MSFLFTSESVSDGHPDKVCDAISDALLDAHLSKDKSARCAIETMATTDHVFIAGEISSQSPLSSHSARSYLSPARYSRICRADPL